MFKRIVLSSKIQYRLIIIGVLIWLAVNLVFTITNFDWLGETDTILYWRVSRNLSSFSSAVTIGYPLIWRGVTDIFPNVSSIALGQTVAACAYVLNIVVVYELLKAIGFLQPAAGALVFALFPLTGVYNALLPRVNTLLLLSVCFALLSYVQNRKWPFIIAISIIPLLHRSALPLIGVLTLVGLWQRRIKLWMFVPMAIPLIIYWIAGISTNDNVFWYLGGYRYYQIVLGLPLGDGLLGTLVLGLRGSWIDVVQGVFLVAYWSCAVYLFFTRMWRQQPFLLAMIIPVIFLGLVLPANEIWSMYNLTPYFVIPVLVYLQQKHFLPSNRILWASILGGCFVSQFVWAAYVVYVARLT